MKKLLLFAGLVCLTMTTIAQTKTKNGLSCKESTPLKNAKSEWAVASGFTTITDINGVDHNIQSDLDAGKYVIVDVSATWCGPCWSLHQSGVFEDLWNDYGPDGTDELMVYWIEIDPDTGIDDIEGNTSASQGDWTNGGDFPVPIINDRSASDPFSELYTGYVPEVYMVCPSGGYKIITDEASTGASAVYNTINSCPSDNNDMELTGISVSNSTSGCTLGDTETISIDVTNIGLDDVSDLEVSYSINGATPVTENLTGPITSFETFTYEFSQTADFSAMGTYEITASVSWPEDPDNTDNSKTTIAVSGDSQLELDLTLDDYPGETSWELVDDMTGIVLAQSPEYSSAGATISETFCLLSSACYTFTIYDEYGDGICCSYGNGSYTLTIDGTEIASGGNFGASESTSVDAQVDVDLNDMTVCTGETITYESGGSGTFSPDPGDIDNTTVGETEVTYTMNEGNTCEVSESFTVYVVDDIINMDITPEDISVCQGETIEFPSGNGVFDPASVDNSTPGSTTVTYYLAQGTDCENSATFDVTVLESPDAPVELSENHVLSTTAGGELQWYFEGDTIDGATDLTYTCTEDGDYYLVVTASNGCSTQSDVINVTGTDVESNNVHDFKIYPNPAREKVFVELPQKPVQLTVYDITGKTLLKNNNFSSGVIDISGFHQGVYMIKINIGNQYGIKKLIIK